MSRYYEETIVVLREFDCVCLRNSLRHHLSGNVAEKTGSANSASYLNWACLALRKAALDRRSPNEDTRYGQWGGLVTLRSGRA